MISQIFRPKSLNGNFHLCFPINITRSVQDFNSLHQRSYFWVNSNTMLSVIFVLESLKCWLCYKFEGMVFWPCILICFIIFLFAAVDLMAVIGGHRGISPIYLSELYNFCWDYCHFLWLSSCCFIFIYMKCFASKKNITRVLWLDSIRFEENQI